MNREFGRWLVRDSFPSSFTMRHAKSADAPALLEHLRKLNSEQLNCLPRMRCLPTLEQEVAYIEELSANGLLLVAYESAQVVGILSIVRPGFRERRHSGSLGMSVTREFRSIGIGRNMLQYAKRWAKSEGLRRVELAVFANNTAAKALYESEGFQVEGTQRHGAFVENAYIDIVLMCHYT